MRSQLAFSVLVSLTIIGFAAACDGGGQKPQVSQKAESEEECANACKADENCAMFSFWESLKMCAMLSDDLEWNEKPEEGGEEEDEAEPETKEAKEECYKDESDPKGKKYAGTVNTTVTGKTCQAWGAQKPHKHRFGKHAGDSNYCRNLDKHTNPWCYTTDPKKRWEDCKVLCD